MALLIARNRGAERTLLRLKCRQPTHTDGVRQRPTAFPHVYSRDRLLRRNKLRLCAVGFVVPESTAITDVDPPFCLRQKTFEWQCCRRRL